MRIVSVAHGTSLFSPTDSSDAASRSAVRRTLSAITLRAPSVQLAVTSEAIRKFLPFTRLEVGRDEGRFSGTGRRGDPYHVLLERDVERAKAV
jgi:hypothetical protein